MYNYNCLQFITHMHCTLWDGICITAGQCMMCSVSLVIIVISAHSYIASTARFGYKSFITHC